MSVEYIWYLGLLAACFLLVAGGIAVPMLRVFNRVLKLEFLEGLKFVPATRMLWIGGGLLIALFVLSYAKTGHIVGMLPPPPPAAVQQRTLADPKADRLKAQMLSDLPRDKPVTVVAMLTHEEGCRFANEIHAFLKQNGFNMKDERASCEGIVVPVVYGVKFMPEADELKVIVGLPPR
jgi:hypothetical protein